jgi:hypothetical protein
MPFHVNPWSASRLWESSIPDMINMLNENHNLDLAGFCFVLRCSDDRGSDDGEWVNDV